MNAHPVSATPSQFHDSCPACARLHKGRLTGFADNAFFISELRESVAVLHDHQCLNGWSVLLLKDHVEHLSQLPISRQLMLFEDVARVTAAVRSVCQPRRINYECLGNVMAHVHWHVVPRYDAPIDPDPGRPVWLHGKEFLECGADATQAEVLAAKIRAAIPN